MFAAASFGLGFSLLFPFPARSPQPGFPLNVAPCLPRQESGVTGLRRPSAGCNRFICEVWVEPDHVLFCTSSSTARLVAAPSAPPCAAPQAPERERCCCVSDPQEGAAVVLSTSLALEAALGRRRARRQGHHNPRAPPEAPAPLQAVPDLFGPVTSTVPAGATAPSRGREVVIILFNCLQSCCPGFSAPVPLPKLREAQAALFGVAHAARPGRVSSQNPAAGGKGCPALGFVPAQLGAEGIPARSVPAPGDSQCVSCLASARSPVKERAFSCCSLRFEARVKCRSPSWLERGFPACLVP